MKAQDVEKIIEFFKNKKEFVKTINELKIKENDIVGQISVLNQIVNDINAKRENAINGLSTGRASLQEKVTKLANQLKELYADGKMKDAVVSEDELLKIFNAVMDTPDSTLKINMSEKNSLAKLIGTIDQQITNAISDNDQKRALLGREKAPLPNSFCDGCGLNCSGDCLGNCHNKCFDSCAGGCLGSCEGGCFNSCEGTCVITCEGSCMGIKQMVHDHDNK